MGLLFSKFYSIESKILLLGLDGAGKTSLLYKLRLDKDITTVPTIGFNVERIKNKNMTITVWDMGGQDKLRNLWKHYLSGADGLVFMIDSCDHERIHLANEELYKIVCMPNQSLKYILILANKCDKQSSNRDIKRTFSTSFINCKSDFIYCSATDGTGIEQIMELMYENLKN